MVQWNEWMSKIKNKVSSIWKSSKYFRAMSIICGMVAFRSVYVIYWRRHKNLPPGTIGIPIFGDGLSMFNLNWSIKGIGSYPFVSSFDLGPSIHVVAINNPHLIKQLYRDPQTLNLGLPLYNMDTFFSKNGKEWESRRRIIHSHLASITQTSFLENVMKQFILNKVCPVIDDKISKNEKIDTKLLFRPLAFNTLLQGFFSKELESIYDPFWLSNDVMIHNMVNHQKYEWILTWIFSKKNTGKIMNKFGLYYREFEGLTNSMYEFAINDKNKIEIDKIYDKNNFSTFNEYYEQMKKHGYTKQQVLCDLSMVFFAAIDTTYSSLTFTLLMAAKYPSIQEEIYNELNHAFDKNVNNVTVSKIGLVKIPKLRALFHESMRINTIAPLSGFRKIAGDGFKIDTTKFGGDKIYNVPKGHRIAINCRGIHYNPKWWVQQYDPINNKNHKNIDMSKPHLEFWIDEKDGKFNKKRNYDAWLPFGKGKRDCMGQVLVLKEVILTLSIIFMKYKVCGPHGNSNFNLSHVISNSVQPFPTIIVFESR